VRPEWLAGKRRIGVSAGASAPEVLVTQVLDRLRSLGAQRVTPLAGVTEGIVFTLPRGLTHSPSEGR
jgi:4-hydroxy-3-methylbut-2-en-1-yl diphosphate reductase